VKHGRLRPHGPSTRAPAAPALIGGAPAHRGADARSPLKHQRRRGQHVRREPRPPPAAQCRARGRGREEAAPVRQAPSILEMPEPAASSPPVVQRGAGEDQAPLQEGRDHAQQRQGRQKVRGRGRGGQSLDGTVGLDLQHIKAQLDVGRKGWVAGSSCEPMHTQTFPDMWWLCQACHHHAHTHIGNPG
jgi:hypothetical protein